MRFPEQRRAKREKPKPDGLPSGVVGLQYGIVEDQWNALESAAVVGDSPVHENLKQPSMFLSRTGHEKPCLNLGGPPSKAKYVSATDSEPVP